MICSNCDNYKLLLELEEFIVSNKPAASRYIQTIIEECFRIAHEDFRCNGCGGLVVKGESYIKDNDKYKKLISEYYVKYDPYNLASRKHRKMFFHYAERYEPNFQGNHDDHDDDDDLTMPPDVCQLAQTPWSSGLGDLRRDYNQDKSVAMSDPLCKKLEEYIQNNYSQKKYYTLSKNRLIFRARPSPINKSLGKGDMWEPPADADKKPKQGRCNERGVSRLYSSNNKEVIKKEVPLEDGEKHNIAKFILHKSVCLFPINYAFENELSVLVNEEVPEEDRDLPDKLQYSLTNLVTNICYNIGYDGVVYQSSKDYSSLNYALFCKYTKGEDIEVLDVEV